MRVIIAEDDITNRVVYINADKICSFHGGEDGQCTKIYFDNGKCRIKGDKVKEIFDYVTIQCNSEPILNLVDDTEVKEND